MQIVSSVSKKFLASLLVCVMVFSSMMPFVASAAEAVTTSAPVCPDLSAGDRFKVKGFATIYLVNAKGERLFFPTADVYKTWYENYNGVVEIDTSCVDTYPAPSALPFMVTYRPGTRLVTTQLTSAVYAVLPGGRLEKLGSENVAKELYGADWGSRVFDVHDVYFVNYKVSDSMIGGVLPHDGMMLKMDNKYLVVKGTALYDVTSYGAPEFLKPFFVQVPNNSNLASLLSGFTPMTLPAGTSLHNILDTSAYTQIPTQPNFPSGNMIEKDVAAYTYAQGMGINDTFSMRYPDHWETATQAEAEELLQQYALENNDAEIVDFSAYLLESETVLGMAMVLAERNDTASSEDSFAQLFEELQSENSELRQMFDAFAELGLIFSVSELQAVSIDSHAGQKLDITLEAEGQHLMQYSIVAVENGENTYFLLYLVADQTGDADQYTTVFDYMMNSFTFN